MTDDSPKQSASTRAARPSADDLAALALGGDEQAFEELHRRLGGGLRKFFQRRISGRDEIIEELSQTTWMETWRALREQRYDPQRARISTFVYAVGYKLLLRHFQAVRRHGCIGPSVGATELAEPTVTQQPDALLHECELLDAVRDCIHQRGASYTLTEEERAVVVGSADNESERALGRCLGVAASTINTRKKSAYQKLRRCLSLKGFGSEVVERGAPSGE